MLLRRNKEWLTVDVLSLFSAVRLLGIPTREIRQNYVGSGTLDGLTARLVSSTIAVHRFRLLHLYR